MFWNHDTDAEESARPEGDLNRLAAVTTSDAKWMENGHDGPGLYANAKVFGDYADKVKEMGPHIGLSIRAGGDRNESAIAPDGKPRVITALKNAASVDFVTKAGRDGKIFTESATREGEDMDKTEIQALIKESLAPLQAENKQLREMLATTRGPALIAKHLQGIRLPEKAKQKITEALSLSIPVTEAGQVDDAKLKTLVRAPRRRTGRKPCGIWASTRTPQPLASASPKRNCFRWPRRWTWSAIRFTSRSRTSSSGRRSARVRTMKTHASCARKRAGRSKKGGLPNGCK